MDIHSYYNGLLYSYGYKEKAVPDNIEEIIAMAEKAVTAIPEMKAVKASALGMKHNKACILKAIPKYSFPCHQCKNFIESESMLKSYTLTNFLHTSCLAILYV